MKGAEGVVESVGFRSTRIRTANKSLVTIPSSQLVNGAVDNQGSRKYREVRTTLSLSFDTPSQVLTDFISEISDMLAQHPLVHKKFIRVGLVDVASRKLDIALSFLLKTPDDAGEIRERQAIFIKILKLAEEKSIDFA
ncbi:MAG: mechanosensitive ion channel family protein [Methylococcaceae bacterium]